MKLGKYSFGIGDRFGCQGEAQLKAIDKANEAGIEITPVWNKSYREHQIVQSKPEDTRKEADSAVKNLNWSHNYFVDADHVNLKNVDYFLDSSDFFTLDVADFIGMKASEDRIKEFVKKNQKFIGQLKLPGIDQLFLINEELIKSIVEKYLYAIDQASKVYQHICKNKTTAGFIVEVSMDETEKPQTPLEMLFILSAIADLDIPVDTIAPKFTGDFYKGIDYAGDPVKFAQEFEEDLMVIQFAIKEFNLNPDLKLSVHSGSDKYSIYHCIEQALKKYDGGVHIKTAGTTWLEELIGLALAEDNGLRIVKKIYRAAFERMDELCLPYTTVINIDKKNLPTPKNVEHWDGEQFANTLRHDQSNPNYNCNFRQLLHVGYKIAAELGDKYYQALEEHKKIIGQNVTENLFDRHIKRIFF